MLKNTIVVKGFDDLNELLSRYDIPKNDYCLIGGVALAILGLRVNNDVDILLGEKYLDKIKEDYPNSFKWNECEIIQIGNIDIKRDYYGRVGVIDNVILNDDSFHFISERNQYKVVRPELVFATKVIRGAPHDLRDIKLLENEIENDNIDWDWSLVRRLLLYRQNHEPATIKLDPQSKSAMSFKEKSVSSRLSNAIYQYKNHPLKAAKITLKKSLNKLGLESAYPSPAKNKERTSKITQSNLDDSVIEFESQIVKLISTSALLNLQIYDDTFNRYDILLRYLVLSAISSNQPTDVDRYLEFYWEMQHKRVGKRGASMYSESGLVDLLKSMQNTGFNKKYPIPVSEEGTLIDGAHRLACALLTGIEYVPIRILPNRQKIDFGRKWFVQNMFSESVIKEMDDLLEKLFFANGIYFVAIVWPPAFSFADDIQSDISDKYRIVKSFDIGLPEDSFPDFAREIYAIDDIDKWKIEVKISAMSSYPKYLRAIYFEIKDPAFRVKEKPRSYLSKKGEKLKKEIRNKYKNKIQDYFYDIIFHTGDNQEHNLAMTQTIAKYDKNVEELMRVK